MRNQASFSSFVPREMYALVASPTWTQHTTDEDTRHTQRDTPHTPRHTQTHTQTPAPPAPTHQHHTLAQTNDLLAHKLSHKHGQHNDVQRVKQCDLKSHCISLAPDGRKKTLSDESQGQQGLPSAPIHMRSRLMLCSPQHSCVLIPHHSIISV